jgi:hypothetical protein
MEVQAVANKNAEFERFLHETPGLENNNSFGDFPERMGFSHSLLYSSTQMWPLLAGYIISF